jgi:endonuclease/exonuclease/phosphatase family metal-dependent hydrolase
MSNKLLRIRKFKRIDRVIAVLHGLATPFFILAMMAWIISPADFWPVAFAGLAFPFLFIAHVVFTVLWAIRKQFLIVGVAALILLFALPQFNAFFVIWSRNDKLDNPHAEFKVMSYNVRLFDLYNWTKNNRTRQQIFRFLEAQQPDIICFQEFYMRTNGSFPTRDSLAGLLDMPYIHEGYTHEIHGEQFFGLATMSRFPIVRQQVHRFSNDENNLCIASDIRINDDTIRVLNVHFQSVRFKKEDYDAIGDTPEHGTAHDPEREQHIFSKLKSAFQYRAVQSEQIRKAIEESPFPVILCGDFNDTPASYTYGQFQDILCDAQKESGGGMGNTYIGVFPSFRIDYIFHSPELHSYGFVTHDERFSDHRAISTVIQIPER